jgi:glycosyltransferase involved in cell wall biosynthesis
VEAAACGCPVIATKASPLAQLLGDGGIYIDPSEPDIARALEAVLSSEDLRLRMGECGLAAAHRLTWEGAARQMMDILGKVAP